MEIMPYCIENAGPLMHSKQHKCKYKNVFTVENSPPFQILANLGKLLND